MNDAELLAEFEMLYGRGPKHARVIAMAREALEARELRTTDAAPAERDPDESLQG